MNSTDGSKLQASGFAEFIQIWFVLEEVCVKALVVQGQVRLDIVSEFDDFYIDAFLGKLILHCIDDLFMRNGGDADFDGRCFGSGACSLGSSRFSPPQPAMRPAAARAARETARVLR